MDITEKCAKKLADSAYPDCASRYVFFAAGIHGQHQSSACLPAWLAGGAAGCTGL
jgi:hypothetical protein